MEIDFGMRGFHALRAVNEGFGRRFRRQNVDESAILCAVVLMWKIDTDIN